MDHIGKIEYLSIHHTGRNNDFPFFVRLRHKYLRGWDDIGYHYLIGNTRPFTEEGKIYSGRPEEFDGAHTRGYNHNSLGVCLIGDFDRVSPSERQLETLFAFLEQKIKQHDVPTKNVMGHNEFPGMTTSCPGNFLDMNYVRAVLSGQEVFSFSYYAKLVRQKKGMVRGVRTFESE
jgi:N-acetylmuramoyl-L-alanine amidase